MLDTMSKFNLGDAYILDEQKVLSSMKLDEAKSLAKKEARWKKKMYYVVAGDAKSQLGRISKLGYGKPVILDRDGNKVK